MEGRRLLSVKKNVSYLVHQTWEIKYLEPRKNELVSSKKLEHLAMKLTLAQTLAGVAVFVEFKNVVKDFILKTEKKC